MTDPEFFEERAAIREFDAGMSREKAEAAAILDVEQYRHACEVRDCIRRYYPNASAMRAFLDDVAKARGVEAMERLRQDCLKAWKK